LIGLRNNILPEDNFSNLSGRAGVNFLVSQSQPSSMQSFILLSSLLAFFASAVYSTALTYKLGANEKSCFFTFVEQKGAKVAFYFAVCRSIFTTITELTFFCYQVQSGGSFDVDYTVVGPNEKVILDGSKERQGDFVFTANDAGEYRFCFNNEMSTFAEKMVDFEIAVGLPSPRPQSFWANS